MPTAKFSFSTCDVFRHHKPLDQEDMSSRMLAGLDGAFREFIRESGGNVDEPSVGVVVQHTSRGSIEGCRLVKCGKVKPAGLNTVDVWPEAAQAKITIPEFDLSIFGDYNGILVSSWEEVPFKIRVQEEDGSWTPVKGAEKERLYGSLMMRIVFVPISLSKMKFVIQALPCSKATLQQLGDDTRSRAYPGIKIHEGRAVIISEEHTHQRWGLGVQPFFLPSDATLDEEGFVDPTGVRWPSSTDVKVAVASLLRSAVMPNWHERVGTWEDSIKNKKWAKRVPKELWCQPRVEDDEETGAEDEDSESEGESQSLV